MEGTFFNASDFPDGELGWNAMEADFDPLTEEYDRDLMFVRYPNGCVLDLEWRGSFSGRPIGFTISLVQTDGEWEPFKQVRCDRLEDLKEVVRCCAREAAERPSIRRHLTADWRMNSPFHEPEVDELVLDALAPLADQAEALKSLMFVGTKGFEKCLTIGWTPPHTYPGEFVVRHYRDDVGRWDCNGPTVEYPRASWELVREWRCETLDDLRHLVEAIDAKWGTKPHD
jgi:hypothetical protein